MPAPLATLTLALSVSIPAGIVNVAQNAGFESGELDPWYQDVDEGGPEDWNVTESDEQSGRYSATVRGPKSLRQNFEPIDGDTVLEISFWLRHPEIGSSRVTLFYDDGTTGATIVEASTSDWEFFLLTPLLDRNRRLIGFAVYGFGDGGLKDRTFLDEVVILVDRPDCPEDLDRSGAVDFGDIVILLTSWGTAGGPFDLDESGLVDIGDLLRVLTAWGKCPEPA